MSVYHLFPPGRNKTEIAQARRMDDMEAWCSLSPFPVVSADATGANTRGSLDDLSQLSAIHEAIEIGAFGNAELVLNEWGKAHWPVAIRNRQTLEIEFLLAPVDGQLKYFRLSK